MRVNRAGNRAVRVAIAIACGWTGLSSAACTTEMGRRLKEPVPVDLHRIRSGSEPNVSSAALRWLEEGSTEGPRVLGLGEPTHGTLEARALAADIIREVVRRSARVAVFGEWCDVEGAEIDAFVGRGDPQTRVPQVGGAPFRSETFAAIWSELREQRNADQRYVRIYGMRPCVPRYQAAHLAAIVDDARIGSTARLRAAAQKQDVRALRVELERLELASTSPMVEYQISLVEQSLALIDADHADEDADDRDGRGRVRGREPR